MAEKKKTTIVHRYKTFNRWKGKKYANNIDGLWLLSSDITLSDFNNVHIIDHRRTVKRRLMSRESM